MGLFDFLSLALFAGLIVLFLQRSIEPGDHRDHLWQYLCAAVGCAVANYLGDQRYIWAATIVLVGVMAFVFYVLRPFRVAPPR